MRESRIKKSEQRESRPWLLATLMMLFFTNASSVASSVSATEQSVQDHLRWIESCSTNSVSVIRSEIVIYSLEVGDFGEDVISCLLAGLNPTPPDHPFVGGDGFTLFSSPVDLIFLGDGPPQPMREGLVLTGTKALIFSGVDSDFGVLSVGKGLGRSFIIQTGYATHDRNYIFSEETDEVSSLPNGDATLVDAENQIFLVKGIKSYFKIGGAFWFDALIDRDGNILKIDPPNWNIGTVTCFSGEEATAQTNLDLSHLNSLEFCVVH